MQMTTKDGFALIAVDDLHKIKELAFRMQNFMATYQSYNKKLNVLVNDVGVYGSFRDTYSAYNRKLNSIIKLAGEILHTTEGV